MPNEDRRGTRRGAGCLWSAGDGSVRQLWELSNDAGATWTVLFDGRYVRAR